MNAVVVQLSDEQMDEIKRMEDERLSLLDAVGLKLETLKDEAVTARSEIEKRWMDDWDQYNGNPVGRGATKEFSSDEPDYRKARDNITRPKVHLMRSRLVDLLFPTNESNWDLRASPVPDLVDPDAIAIDPMTGEQVPAAELVAKKSDEAKRKCSRQKNLVEDQLAESKFDSEGREALADLSLYGTCVIKGPFVKSVKRQVWRESNGMATLETTYVEKPAVRRVDLWAFYPQPCREISEAEHAFELHMMTPKKVRSLAKQPGFNEEQVKRLLEKEAELGTLANSIARRSDGGISEQFDKRYPVWEFHGPIPKDALVAFLESMVGKVEDDLTPLIEEITEQPLNVVYAEVWFSQGVVLKAIPTQLDDDDPLIYRVTNLERNPDSWAGFGVAYWLRDDQISRNALWHAILLNAIMSSGPQLGVLKGAISTEAGRKADYSCVTPRVWILSEDIQDIRQAITAFTVPNVLKGIMPVYDQVGRSADERSLLPLVMQGDATRATPTSSGVAMLMNQANIGIAMIARDWDDNITAPLIDAFVDHNMRSPGNDDAKGDFEVLPKAASYLLVKDVKIQHLQVATQLAMNPAFSPYFKMDELAKANVELLSIDYEDLLKTPEELQAEAEAAAENPQPDPETIKAEAARDSAAAARSRADTAAQKAQLDAQTAQQDRMLDHQEFQMKLQDNEQERQVKMLIQRILFEMEQMKLAQSGEIEADKMISVKEIAALEMQLKEFQTALDGRLEAARVAQGDRKLNAQLRFERPFRTE